ncbi:MAG: transglycosylase domain-containing protein [Gammaproteobacteria bacterium]
MSGRRHRRIILAVGAAGVLIACAALATFTWRDLAPLPESLPPKTVQVAAQILARDGTPLSASYDGRFNRAAELSLVRIPSLLRKAFVASEDRHYWTHGGSDWRARFAALWQNLRARHVVRGASTIGEQAARILTPRPRSYWSHWLAGIEAGRLIHRFGRAKVLEFYLNQVPYGAQRRGVEQAARYYFTSDVAALDPAEQLALAVLVRSPVAYDPRRHPQALRRAVNALAQRMHKEGVINAAEAFAVQRAPITPGEERTPVVAGPFVAYARDRIRTLGRAVPAVTTTLDPDLERFVQQALRTRLAALRDQGVSDAAALVVDNASGAVLAWAVAPARGATDIDPVLVPRQPGSTLKPFLYALAMERLGWQPDTVLRDGPLSTPIKNGVHQFSNYSDRYYGQVSLRYALGNSLNIPAVETAAAVGVAPLLDLLHQLGVTTLDRAPAYYGPALAIGDGPVRLLDLVQAYSALARRGRYLPLKVLADVPEPAAVAVLRPDVASLIASILSDPDARATEFGTASVLDLPQPTAAKTGTSSNYRDAWTFGFDNRYTVGVWMGRLAGGYMNRITGSAGPALVLRSVFAHLRTNQPYAGLWRSPDLVAVRVCERIGPGPCIERDDWHLQSAATEVAHTDKRKPLRIARPLPGETLAYNPRIARTNQIYDFRIADANDAVQKVAWYLDGKLLGRTTATTRGWPLESGEHKLSARVWTAASERPLTLGPVDFSVE